MYHPSCIIVTAYLCFVQYIVHRKQLWSPPFFCTSAVSYRRFGADMLSRIVGSQLPNIRPATSDLNHPAVRVWNLARILHSSNSLVRIGTGNAECLLWVGNWIYTFYLRELRAAHSRAIIQAVSRRSLAAERRVRSQASTCEICDVQSGTGTGSSQRFPPSVSVHHWATPYSSSSTRCSVLTVRF
jgi:hypothetical protein